MARRKVELFNLSFLDLLTSALGAIIFLFIVVPKGGEAAAPVQQAAIYLDTVQMKIHGPLADSLRTKQAGDTLFAIVVDHQRLPEPPKPQPEAKPERPVVERTPPPRPQPQAPQPSEKPQPQPSAPVVQQPADPTPEPARPVQYKGDMPSVPARVSFEINWANKEDNVDLFVCKGGSCVYGGRKNVRDIGQWDSGKSRNRLIGNDLRTNQEAVRQFDAVIPGEYQVYAEFKESSKNQSSVTITGLVYTKGENGQERGQSFSRRLSLGAERVLIGTVVIQKNGEFQFKSR